MNPSLQSTAPSPNHTTLQRGRRTASLARLASCVALVGLSALLAVSGGCQAKRDTTQASPGYPTDKPQTRTLDIQVVRAETTLTLTNTTARSYGQSRLWLNRWYSRTIDGLAVGQTLELPLNTFRDQYGERIRSGGFFATRKPETVELVQLETADAVLGLVAVGRVD